MSAFEGNADIAVPYTRVNLAIGDLQQKALSSYVALKYKRSGSPWGQLLKERMAALLSNSPWPRVEHRAVHPSEIQASA
jgi:hypothetical protein